MAVIQIEIDIENPNQVIERQKGKLTELFAGIFMDGKKLKREVEASVCKEIVKMLEPKIAQGLTEKGISANVKYTVVKKH